jgi:esterase/lipase superfamily enzyme
MKHYFITNREIIGKYPNESIRKDGREKAGDNLRFGTYDIASKTFELFPEPKTQAELVYATSTNTEFLGGSNRFFHEVYNQLTSADGDVLVFIHGFNTDLNDVEKAFQRLHEVYVAPTGSNIQQIILITWPSRSPQLPLHYNNDQRDAKRSGEAFARSVDKLITFFKQVLGDPKDGKLKPCGKNLHLMAHSMGNQVLEHMVNTLKRKSDLPELFKTIHLIAADVRYDIFNRGQAFEHLIDMGQYVFNYYHRGDQALDISKYTKNMNNRLGRYGRMRKDPLLLEIEDIDCTNMPQDLGDAVDRKVDHWYYYTSSQAIAKIRENLKKD